MIAFGASVSEVEPYRRYAEPGIRRAAEADSALYSFASVGTIGRTYNLLLEEAGRREDLEALVLVHPHAEIADPELCGKIRHAFADSDVAVLGCAGAREVRSVAWWEGVVSIGRVTHRYLEFGGGEMPAYGWTAREPAPREVDVVDGFMFVLSPWAVRNVRFDEALWSGHGFDYDLCRQIRPAGRKVMTADIHVVQHRSLDLVSDVELWTEAHVALSRKWQGGELDQAGWKARARRGEAEREAARAMAYSRRLLADARIKEAEQGLGQATTSLSWRLTEPLRVCNQWRRRRRAASAVKAG